MMFEYLKYYFKYYLLLECLFFEQNQEIYII